MQTTAGRLQASPSPCSVLPLIGNGLEGLGHKVPYVAILLYDSHSADWPFSPTHPLEACSDNLRPGLMLFQERFNRFARLNRQKPTLISEFRNLGSPVLQNFSVCNSI